MVYYVPDEVQFKAGMNQYRELDLPFEEGFGEYTTTPYDLIRALKSIVDNNYAPSQLYAERMNSFFIKNNERANSLYNRLMSSNE